MKQRQEVRDQKRGNRKFRSQKAEIGNQTPEGRDRISEIEKKLEIRHRTSEVNNQKSEDRKPRNRKSEIGNMKARKQKSGSQNIESREPEIGRSEIAS